MKTTKIIQIAWVGDPSQDNNTCGIKIRQGGGIHVADVNAQPNPDPHQPSGITLRELLNGKQTPREN